MTPHATTALVKRLARGVGLHHVGICRAAPIDRGAYYRQWLDAGHAGEMTYLHRNVPYRENPAGLLPGCRSIICAALPYGRREPPESGSSPGAGTSASQSLKAVPRGTSLLKGRVAQYARGRDYHVVFRQLLTDLVERVRAELSEPAEFRIFVDTGPLLEREIAAAAGLGWIGRNTLLLHPRLGSYFFLGEVLTTLELEPDDVLTDHCGTCTRCLDACPTRAFPAAYQLDAARCISYLTIEHRSEVPAELHGAMGDWIFGCDVCQEVCPFNRKAPPAEQPDIAADVLPPALDLLKLVHLRSGEYRRLTNGTAARRASRKMWRRNAAIALRNAESRLEATGVRR